MDSSTTMFLVLGGSCLLIASMMVVCGIILVTAESGQRIMAVTFGVLLGALGLMIMTSFAAPRATVTAYNGMLWGSVISGTIAAALLGWKRMAS